MALYKIYLLQPISAWRSLQQFLLPHQKRLGPNNKNNSFVVFIIREHIFSCLFDLRVWIFKKCTFYFKQIFRILTINVARFIFLNWHAINGRKAKIFSLLLFRFFSASFAPLKCLRICSTVSGAFFSLGNTHNSFGNKKLFLRLSIQYFDSTLLALSFQEVYRHGPESNFSSSDEASDFLEYFLNLSDARKKIWRRCCP